VDETFDNAVRDPLVAEALRNFTVAESSYSKIRKEGATDHKYFVGGELQWDADIRDARIGDKRPTLTFNQLQQFVYNVVNEKKQNPSEAAINPTSDDASEETSNVLQDIIRDIRAQSHGSPDLRAYKDCVIAGEGYFRLCTEYKPKSNKQVIRLCPVQSASCVYYDPYATYPTYHDAEFCFVFTDVSRNQFKRMYPKATSTTTFDPWNHDTRDWITENKVRIAEYFYVKHTQKRIVSLQDGTDKYEDELDGMRDYPLLDSDGAPISRLEDIRTVYRCVISAAEVLEQPVEWITPFIPIIPILGEEEIIEGERYLFGMMRSARDPQAASNLMQNLLIEGIAASTKAPYLLDPKHIEEFEQYWANANTKNYSFLPTHLVAEDGVTPLPPPIRNNAEPPVQAIQASITQQNLNLQQSMGTYAATLGQEGPEESAKAILARQQPGEKSNFRFIDAYNIAWKYAAMQLLMMIPVVYDVPQVLHLEGLDKKAYQAAVFNSQASGLSMDQLQAAQGVKGVFDLSQGDYSAAISMAPNYETGRKETQAFFAAFAQAAPEMVPRFADLWARSMDFPEKDELADRLTPADVKQQNGDPQAQIAQLGQQNQVLSAQVQHLSQMVQEMAFEKKAKHAELVKVAAIDQAKIQSNERIQTSKNRVSLIETAAKLSEQGAGRMLDHEIGRIQQDKDHSHEIHMALFDAANSMASQDSEHQHQMNMQPEESAVDESAA
jgi:hypothetical protein